MKVADRNNIAHGYFTYKQMMTELESPLVTIVIPTYNQASYLKEALASVLAQTESRWRVIVVNNYSDDDTETVVTGFSEPRFKLINYHNNGIIGASRNIGIQESQTEWVAFLDSDDSWCPDKLQKCLQATDAAVDLVAHGLLYVQNGDVIRHHASGPESALSYKSLLYGRNALTPSAVLIRRSRLIEVGGFSENPMHVTAEDHDLWLKLARSETHCRVIDDSLTRYRIHDSNASHVGLKQMNASIAVLTSHYQSLASRNVFDVLQFRRIIAINYYGGARLMQKQDRLGKSLYWYWRSFFTYPLYLRTPFGLLSLFPLLLNRLLGFAKNNK